MNKLGLRSVEVADTLHLDLQKVIYLAIGRSNVDFGLHEGAREITTQQGYYDSIPKKTSINPRDYSSPEALARVAKHITIPGSELYSLSRAVDLHVSEKYEGKQLAWDDVHLAYVAGVIISCAKELYEKGEISHIVRGGIDWDNDGVLILDQRLKDLPHFELIKP